MKYTFWDQFHLMIFAQEDGFHVTYSLGGERETGFIPAGQVV